MDLKIKLNACAALSIIALIFKIIVFVSPGWVVINQDINVGSMATDDVIPADNEHHSDSQIPMVQHYTMSFGAWYYKVCKHDKCDKENEDSDKKHKHHKCYHASYKGHKKEEPTDMVFDDTIDRPQALSIAVEKPGPHIPREFEPARDMITTAVEFASYVRSVFAIYATIGVVLGIIGTIGAILYRRSNGTGKHSGRLASATQFFSSFFYWLGIISVTSYVIQLIVVRDSGLMDGEISRDTRFAVPWCLVLGAVGALVMDIAALFHLILISRDRELDNTSFSFKAAAKYPIISHTGDSKLMFQYVQMTEEAGALPEKQPIA